MLWRMDTSCLVRTVGADVVGTFPGQFSQLQDAYPKANNGMTFGTEQSFLNIDINDIAQVIERDKFTAMTVFHCLQIVILLLYSN